MPHKLIIILQRTSALDNLITCRLNISSLQVQTEDMFLFTLLMLTSSTRIANSNSTRDDYVYSISPNRAWVYWMKEGASLDENQEENERVKQAQSRCLEELRKPRSTPGGLYCEGTWDHIMCWPDTRAGEVSTQPCPSYINDFNKNGNASRKCMDDGRWFVHPQRKFPWTNFSLCAKEESPADVINSHLYIFKMISQIGYGLSVVALTGAIFITLYFRRLRCARNMLHINLYASFIARAVLTFLRNWLFVLGLGFLKDFRVKADSSLEFREDISHWECKLFMTIFNYAMMTNCTWIFVEGLYIHTIIFFDIFLESTSIKGYVALGWGVSLLFLLPWVLVKLTLDNSYCWNIQLIEGTFWIIKGPLVVSVLINFVFFVNVVRVLFTKLKANSSSECRTNRHKTFARSTLVLIPLFGVPYIVFLGLPENLSVVAELVKIYFEITFNSFNGFLVAILFCYLNGEVQNELKKAWNLHSLKRNANWRCSQTENVFLEQFAVVQQRNGVCKKEVHKIFTRGKL